MSSSAPSGSERPEEKQQRLSKFMRRASKVLKSGKSTRESAGPGEIYSTPRSSVVEPSLATLPTSSLRPTSVVTKKPDPSAGSPSALVSTDEPPKPAVASNLRASGKHTTIQEERARALFAKYGLTLEPGEWTSPSKSDVERVEKKIRMRVHRFCHRCQTTFGPNRTCSTCQHTRCKKCPRFPVKRSKEPQTMTVGAAANEAAKVQAKARASTLTMPSKVPGKELVRKTPAQRVRRTCHKCDSIFTGKATQCDNCKHLRCAKCPREPPKLTKYPNGYPGDTEETFPLAERQMRNIRVRVRWKCHDCSTTFQERESTCRECKHERCDQCPRHPPKRLKPRLEDTEAVQSLQEKMASISVGS